jgi:tetratricopeptide (TPR) repeat protein
VSSKNVTSSANSYFAKLGASTMVDAVLSEADSNYKLGLHRQYNLEYERAIRPYRRAARLSSFRPDYCYSAGFCFEIIGDYSNSRLYYRLAVAEQSSPSAWRVRLGVVCRRLGRHKEAELQFRAAWLQGVGGAEAAEIGLEGWLPSPGEILQPQQMQAPTSGTAMRDIVAALSANDRRAATEAVAMLSEDPDIAPVIWRFLTTACLVRGCAYAAYKARLAMAAALIRLADNEAVRAAWSLPDLVAAACICTDFKAADRLATAYAPVPDGHISSEHVIIDRLLAEGRVEEARRRFEGAFAGDPYRLFLRDRSCALVGPAVNGLCNGAGIDAHDVVVRTNVGSSKLLDQHAVMIGGRTDAVYYSSEFYRSRREQIDRYLSTSPVRAVSTRHNYARARIKRAAPALESRVWFSHKKRNVVGVGFAFRHIVSDLVLSASDPVDVYGADFYLGEATHFAGYFDEGINVLREFARHDVFDTFEFLKEMTRVGAIRPDTILGDILSLSIEDFCSRIEKRFLPANGGGTLQISRAAAGSAPKIGILRFDYQGFAAFHQELEAKGSYSINLGDAAQSIAVKQALQAISIHDSDVVHLGRDGVANYAGPPAIAIMNAVLYPHCFPLSTHVRPLYFGLHASRSCLRAQLEHLKTREPIGCRDVDTAAFLLKHGVRAFISGCLTLALPPRPFVPADGKVLLVYGQKAGAFPAASLKHMPQDLLDRIVLVDHRLPVWQWPLDAAAMAHVEQIEAGKLRRYAEEAALVVTPLHHVAAPCMAMGIPVVLVREAMDARFSLLKRLLPVYLPDAFDRIDWRPAPFDAAPTRKLQLEVLARMISAERNGHVSNFHLPSDPIFPTAMREE